MKPAAVHVKNNREFDVKLDEKVIFVSLARSYGQMDLSPEYLSSFCRADYDYSKVPATRDEAKSMEMAMTKVAEFAAYEQVPDPESLWQGWDMRRHAPSEVASSESIAVEQWWFTIKFFGNIAAMKHEETVKQAVTSHEYIPGRYREGVGFLSWEAFSEIIEATKAVMKEKKGTDPREPDPVRLVLRSYYMDGDIGCLLYHCVADTLNEMMSNSMLLLPVFKEICRQAIETLVHLHKCYVIHGNINLQSLRIQKVKSGEHEIKLMGFERACYHSTFSGPAEFEAGTLTDIEDLAYVLHLVQREDPDETIESFLANPPNGYDRLLFAHLLEAMKKAIDKPSAEELTRHPFLLKASDSARLFLQIADGFLAAWPLSDVVSRKVSVEVNRGFFTWRGKAPQIIQEYLVQLEKERKAAQKNDDFVELKVQIGHLVAQGQGAEHDISNFVMVRYFQNASSTRKRLIPSTSKYGSTAFDLVRLIKMIGKPYLGWPLQQTFTAMPAALGTLLTENFPMLLLICYRTAFICRMNESPHFSNVFGPFTVREFVLEYPGQRLFSSADQESRAANGLGTNYELLTKMEAEIGDKLPTRVPLPAPVGRRGTTPAGRGPPRFLQTGTVDDELLAGHSRFSYFGSD